MSWQEVFQTDDPKIVEEECSKNGMKFIWNDNNRLTIEWKKEAIWEHLETGEEVWFNHGLFFNQYMLDQEIFSSVEENELPNNTYFGDGSSIPKIIIEEIKNAFDKSLVEFSWQKGDVLFLDNMLMAHGRNPYKGDRKIIVSMF